MVVRVVQQLRHERVRIHDFARAGVEQEDTVLRRFKKTAVADFRNPHLVLFLFKFGDVHDHYLTFLTGGRALRPDADDLERTARAQKLNINGVVGLVGKNLFEERIENGTMSGGNQRSKRLADQTGTFHPDQMCPGEIDLTDGAGGGEGKITHGCEIVEVGIFFQQHFHPIP